MPYRDIFTNDIYQDEHDEEMTRKHPNYYKAIKTFFPEAYKLPEEEITPMIGIMKNKGDTYDDAVNHVKSYITNKMPEWGDFFRPISPPLYIATQTPRIGEAIADTQIAYDVYKQMQNTGKKLVNKYDSGGGADIDNYYHPLLQCHLAKISPESKRNGIGLGYLKEGIMDYVPKRLKGQTHQEVMKDSLKDLNKNEYGSNLGSEYPKKSCVQMLEDERTRNMKSERIY